MTHRLTTNYAKNYCNRTLIVKVIVENVVTCFLGGHGAVYIGEYYCLQCVYGNWWQLLCNLIHIVCFLLHDYCTCKQNCYLI